MHQRRPVPVELLRLAAAQEGVLTREQVLGLGFPRSGAERLVRDGAWHRLAPGVLSTRGDAPTWSALAWAGVLLGGDGARLGGPAAGHLHGLLPEAPGTLDVLVPSTRARPGVAGPWVFRREGPGVRQPRTVGSPPRTGVEDTVLDLVEGTDDARQVVHWVTTAVQSRLTTPERLRRVAGSRRRLRHRRLLAALLDDVAEGVRSPLERDYLHDVERPHGLPTGRRQVRQRGGEVDVEYEEWGVLVELDGRLGHAGAGRFRDMRRDNRSTAAGLLTLRYGHADVSGQACLVARQVAEVLGARGWPGPLVSCRWCRAVA